MKINAKNIAINAIVACLYAVFTIMIAPLAYYKFSLDYLKSWFYYHFIIVNLFLV